MIENFELFGKTITPYAVCVLIGILVAGFYACKTAKKRGYDDNDMIVLLLISMVGVLIGGHILYGIVNFSLLKELILNIGTISTKEIIIYVFYTFGGSVFYGGLIGGIIAGAIYIKCKKFNFIEYSDMLAPVIPLFHAFGRIGCFLSGCCYGIQCNIGFVYKYSIIEQANNVRRFPVQLLESEINFVLFLFLNKMLKQNKFKGKLLYLYLLLYSFARFCLEFLRGDEARGFVFCFSTSQFISIIIFVIACVLLIKYKIQNNKYLNNTKI